MSSSIDSTQPIALHATSDIHRISKVIVHRPDPGIEWVTPTNAESLLYDDIVFLPQMMQQHSMFVAVLQAILGPGSVLEFQDLLAELLDNENVKHQLLKVVFAFESTNLEDQDILNKLPSTTLAATLISGVAPGLPRPILPPLPNHIFTRDIGVVINNGFLTCMSSKRPRMRESILTWFVSHNHPLFQSQSTSNCFIDLCKDQEGLLDVLADSQLAIEGGDVMVINKDNLFIGCSERTTEHTIRKVADLIFEADLATQITLIDIPKLSTCIHLDTLFTQISETDFVYYQPYMGKDELRVIKQFRGSITNEFTYDSLYDLLVEIQPNVNLIPCGNGEYPYEEREQYASGCNFVAMKNGVAISYARNLKTLEALKEHGYKVIDGATLLEEIDKGGIDPDKITNTIITIPSSELSRAGGGPHCLTLPLIRG